MKRIEEMTEEEFRAEAALAIPKYLARIRPHYEFNIKECVAMMEDRIKDLFRKQRGYSVFRPGPNGVCEMDQALSHFEGWMYEMASSAQADYQKSHVLWTIRQTSSTAILEDAFRNAGIKSWSIEPQMYRASVSVDIEGHLAYFYVSYKSLEKDTEAAPRLAQAILDLGSAISRISTNVKVKKRRPY